MAAHTAPLDALLDNETAAFRNRHIGPDATQTAAMLKAVGADDLESFVSSVIPPSFRTDSPYDLPEPLSETEVIERLRSLADKNEVWRTYIGAGYYGTLTPEVIKRKIFENPAWYTQYTPYQAEIAQGRLEALLNFQTMITELTGLDIANASLLDEATAAAEAMTLCKRVTRGGEGKKRFFVSESCHPQTIAVIETRAQPFGYEVVVGDHRQTEIDEGFFGALVQYPATTGEVHDYRDFAEAVHQAGALLVTACDPLALTLLTPPAEFGADVAVGNTQRFGVPFGYGGPHAAYIAVREAHKRKIPGRLVGVSRDREGKPALRLALQTREQHIRRDAATSNICTAQVLLAVMASFYAVYHGPQGLTAIARRVHLLTEALRDGLTALGYECTEGPVFDTLTIRGVEGETDDSSGSSAERADLQHRIRHAAEDHRINLRYYDDGRVGISLDERVGRGDLADLLALFATAKRRNGAPRSEHNVHQVIADASSSLPLQLERRSEFLTDEVFNAYQSETELMRYIQRLESRDLSLVHSMIPLGSCTMKLNAAAEMQAMSWPEFADVHPFVPQEQARGYLELIEELDRWLSDLTGFAATSFQPNSGAQGEYTGLMTIRAYHTARGEGHRDVCLVPESAHGTNPASAVMAGMRVVVIECDDQGNIDRTDLLEKADKHASELAAMMVTYPSTHGVFEEGIRELCDLIHERGGQVYLDGANMNALLGWVRPAELGADVCHLNLHKTFCIPHGGGGPGMGPICAASQLAPFLPRHPFDPRDGGAASGDPAERDHGAGQAAARVGAVAAAPFGSPSILTISYAYIALMGEEGLRQTTNFALLNANYIASRIEGQFPVLYRGRNGRIAHECIVDLRQFKNSAGVESEDVAKRLADYGFHAPTMSWPVPGTLMIEPTESESTGELDRFCEAMTAIWREIEAVRTGEADREANVLKMAPHTIHSVTVDTWELPYTREQAAYPLPWVRDRKFWPAVSRVDNAYGDRHLVCTCAPISAYQESG